MDDFSPYQSPQLYAETPKFDDKAVKPVVVTWYKVYAGFMTALYLFFALAGALLLAFGSELADAETDEMEVQIMGAVYGVLGLFFGVAFGIGLTVPRRRWGWVYSIILICIGLTSCCTLPASIPLLIYWLKAETKSYYGMFA
jgi:hypothetical protein